MRITVDFRNGLRTLRVNPLWTAAALACLAIGTGANTASVSVINAILLRPLPFAEPDRLAVVGVQENGQPRGASLDDYEFLRGGATLLTDLSARTFLPVSVVAGDPARMVQAELVTESYFAALRLKPQIGSFFDSGTGIQEAILSDRLWRTRFLSDPGIVGRTILINGHSAAVSGIAPANFQGATQLIAADMWLPAAMFTALGGSSANPVFGLLGRLAPDATYEQAHQQMNALLSARSRPSLTSTVDPANGFGIPGIRNLTVGGSAFLFLLIGLVMAVAVANVAGLMLARAPGRRREIAMRLSLGATRWDITRQLLVESLLLSLTGAALGAGLAKAITAAVPALGSASLPEHLRYVIDIEPDWRVLLYAALTSILVSGLIAWAPVRQAVRTDLTEAIKPSGSGRTVASTRALDVLVAGQMAVCTVLLLAAAMLAGAYFDARAAESGMDLRSGVAIRLDLRQGSYDRDGGAELFDGLLQYVSSLRGVEAATLSRETPLNLGTPETVRARVDVTEQSVDTKVISPGYFATLRVPMLQGRDFSASDHGAPSIAIVNQAMAGLFWPGRSPVGQTFVVDRETVEVVGVVPMTKYRTITEEPRPAFFRPVAQAYSPQMVLLARTSDPDSLVGPVRTWLQKENINLAMLDARTFAALVEGELAPRQRGALLMAGVCVTGLLLSAVGLYGVIAYSVRQRARELGLRMALGASTGAVRRMVLWRGLKLVVCGFALGLMVSIGFNRVLMSVIAGIARPAPVLYGIVAAALALVALAASYFPARWATNVNPAVALRAE